jgi:phosphatidylethanolamine-binding protein (PEBP) family uncharacterized protein
MLKTFLRQQLPLTRPLVAAPLRIQKMPLLTISNSIQDALSKSEVFPDVLEPFEPKGLLTISYGKSNEVALGNTLSVAETQTKPLFQFTPTETGLLKDGDLFTLVLTDPDAPSRTDKKWSEYAHYVAANIPLSTTAGDADFHSAEIGDKGDVLLKYEGPGPPKGTGKHRYVFLLYKQEQGKVEAQIESRPNWGYGTPATGVAKFAAEHGLLPWAVNFFYAENK